MHRIFLAALCAVVFSNGIVMAKAGLDTAMQKSVAAYHSDQEDPETDLGLYHANVKDEMELLTQPKRYLRISQTEYLDLQNKLRASQAIQQRIRNLEHAYRQIESIIRSFKNTFKLIKVTLGLASEDEIDNRDNDDPTDKFEHPESKIVMNPGSVGFKVKTNFDKDGNALTFADLSIEHIFMDVIFNKNLFKIDHIEGAGVNGEAFKRVSLDRDKRSFKTRVQLPIADVLAKEVEFFIFLKPIEEKIKQGDRTNVEIRYYKRIPRNDDGTPGIAPLVFERNSNNDHIQVTVK